MEKINEFINDVSSKNIFSYEHYKEASLDKKIEIISLLNEYYKLKYSNIYVPKMIVFIDCDGVTLDTIGYAKSLLMHHYGIDYDKHDRSNIDDDTKVNELFKSLDWYQVLHESSEINRSKTFINLFKNSILYYPIMYSSVSSDKEQYYKEIMFREEFKIDYKFGLAKEPKQCEDNKSILIDDDDFNLRYWNGIPVCFASSKKSIFPTINDFGEIYFLFPINEQSLSFNLPSIYDNYIQVICPKTKKLEWKRIKR